MPKDKTNPTPTDEKNIFKAWERCFQTMVYLITSFLNLNVQTEVTKHKGRLDLIATTDDFIYLMEFKLDEPAKDAIKQIKSRKYAAAYENSPKTIFLVGIGFSKNERNVKTWRSQKWKRNK